MRFILASAAVAVLIGCATLPAAAQRTPARPATPTHGAAPAAPTAKPAGPKAIGRFDDWTAATNMEAGQTVCYAFTRVQTSTPAMAGRGDVVLTVTERATPRDAVALSAGFTYAPNASAAVAADAATFQFYTAQRSAFARDGHATVAAFQKAARVTVKSPAPKGVTVTDSFSLRGFGAAYAAILKACPAK